MVKEQIRDASKRDEKRLGAGAGCEEIRIRGKEREGYTVKGYIGGQSY